MSFHSGWRRLNYFKGARERQIKSFLGKGKGSCLESRLHDNACSTGFTFPLARWVPMQPATVDPTLDLCTRYPLRLSGLRQCGIRSLPDTSTHGPHWGSKPRPSDLESNALSTGPHASTISLGNIKIKRLFSIIRKQHYHY